MLLITFNPTPVVAVSVDFNPATRLYDATLHTEKGSTVFASHWQHHQAVNLMHEGQTGFEQRGYLVKHWFMDTMAAVLDGHGNDFAAGKYPSK